MNIRKKGLNRWEVTGAGDDIRVSIWFDKGQPGSMFSRNEDTWSIYVNHTITAQSTRSLADAKRIAIGFAALLRGGQFTWTGGGHFVADNGADYLRIMCDRAEEAREEKV
jgi:hypothetical protein